MYRRVLDKCVLGRPGAQQQTDVILLGQFGACPGCRLRPSFCRELETLPNRREHGLIWGILAGFLLAFPVIGLTGYLYLRYGNVPVAVADKPFPDEEQIVHLALDARINRQTQSSPIQPTPENLLAGAHVFASQCAFCHGAPGEDSAIGHNEYPQAPQLWVKHTHGDVVGVSDDPAGETYWKVANGIRLTGMPAFDHALNETEMWQVSLLLAGADKPQTPEVLAAMRHSVAEFAHPERDNNGNGVK